jgi:hypothetical protein
MWSSRLRKAKLRVASIDRDRQRQLAPFITSSLQQRHRSWVLAEARGDRPGVVWGIGLTEGSEGLITAMRTDRLSV